MSPGRLFAGALVLAAHLSLAPLSHADGSSHGAPAKSLAAPEVRARSAQSPSTLAALAAAGFVPAIIMIARDRRGARSE